MNLAKLKQAATDEFDKLQAEGEKLRTRIQEIEQQLSELRGKYKAYDELDTPADPANTIKAVPAEAKNGKSKSGK